MTREEVIRMARDARPTIANLKQFPFNKTNCPKHEASK